jgi:hypothetical protein
MHSFESANWMSLITAVSAAHSKAYDIADEISYRKSVYAANKAAFSISYFQTIFHSIDAARINSIDAAIYAT